MTRYETRLLCEGTKELEQLSVVDINLLFERGWSSFPIYFHCFYEIHIVTFSRHGKERSCINAAVSCPVQVTKKTQCWGNQLNTILLKTSSFRSTLSRIRTSHRSTCLSRWIQAAQGNKALKNGRWTVLKSCSEALFWSITISTTPNENLQNCRQPWSHGTLEQGRSAYWRGPHTAEGEFNIWQLFDSTLTCPFPPGTRAIIVFTRSEVSLYLLILRALGSTLH